MQQCYTCELLKKRDGGNAPLWDCIYRSPYWDVVHSYNTALLGWLVLVVRRHIEAVDEMTTDEALELGKMIHQVSLVLKEVTGCLKTYVIQFAEHPEHPHVHFHIIPRMADQPEDHKSTNIFKYLGVAEGEQVSKEEMNRIASRVQSSLFEMNSSEA